METAGRSGPWRYEVFTDTFPNDNAASVDTIFQHSMLAECNHCIENTKCKERFFTADPNVEGAVLEEKKVHECGIVLRTMAYIQNDKESMETVAKNQTGACMSLLILFIAYQVINYISYLTGYVNMNPNNDETEDTPKNIAFAHNQRVQSNTFFVSWNVAVAIFACIAIYNMKEEPLRTHVSKYKLQSDIDFTENNPSIIHKGTSHMDDTTFANAFCTHPDLDMFRPIADIWTNDNKDTVHNFFHPHGGEYPGKRYFIAVLGLSVAQVAVSLFMAIAQLTKMSISTKSEKRHRNKFNLLWVWPGTRFVYALMRCARIAQWCIIQFLVLVPMISPCSWAVTQLNYTNDTTGNIVAWLTQVMFPIGIGVFFYFECVRIARHIAYSQKDKGPYYAGIFKDRERAYTKVLLGTRNIFVGCFRKTNVTTEENFELNQFSAGVSAFM